MQTRRMRRRNPSVDARNARGQLASHGSSGFTIVEVMVAVVVLVIAIVGIVGAMLSAMALNRVNRETAIAQQAARRAIEEVSGVPFREAFRIYNNNVGDGGLSMPERGGDFPVLGLQTQVGDPDGMCGRIVFPVDGAPGAETLNELVVDPGLGMPRDLDMLNGIDNNDHTLDYVVLPVRVLVEWRGVSGNRSIELETMMSWQ